MATKATQTHFRGIRLSSQEIAILAKRPIDFADSVNRLEDYVLVSIQRGPRWTAPDVVARGAAAYLGLSKNQRLTELCRKIDAGGDGGRSPEHLAQYDLMPCRKFVSGILSIGAFVQRKLARLPIR